VADPAVKAQKGRMKQRHFNAHIGSRGVAAAFFILLQVWALPNKYLCFA
jgi:hypothetical protein